MLGLRSAKALQELGNEARQALRAVQLEISADARKPPMAVYWACIPVWARHIARAVITLGPEGPSFS